MSGQVLDYEAKRIRDAGFTEGVMIGENKLGSLVIQLLNLGGENDAFQAAADPEYRGKLYREFNMS